MKSHPSNVAVFVESSRGSGRDFLRGVAEYVRTHGRWLVYWQPAGLHAAWPVLKKRQIDAVMVRDVGFIDEMLGLGMPCVVFGHSRPEVPNVINVTTENRVIGRMAAEHLLACGFRHFAYCGISTPARRIDWSDLRGETFAARIAEAGFDCAAFAPPASGAPDWPQERHALVGWLRSLPCPVGCMAANDDRASELAAACKEAGLAVPDEVGIIGADNDELVCGFSDPPLSSISIGFERAGYQAAEALSGLMRRRKRHVQTIVATANHLIVRRSTDFVVATDACLARALRFIRDKADHAMPSILEVARTAGLSRRTLERRFRQTTGMSIHHHISQLRADRISRLLVETNMPVAEIAGHLGFNDIQHFARYFRSQRGMSPLEYRKQRRSAVV
jgi:LacI family transcriptional regulator